MTGARELASPNGRSRPIKNISEKIPMSMNAAARAWLVGTGFVLLGAIANAQPVSCLQEGKMDLSRPEFPSVTCWETLSTQNQSVTQLQEACAIPFGPWEIKSQVVPVCPPVPIGSCFDVKDGQDGEQEVEASLTNTHHYSPQRPDEWRKTAKTCKKAGGRWVGPGKGPSLPGL